MLPLSRGNKAVVVVFLLLCAAWYWHETVITVLPGLGDPSDFKPYWEAARNIVHGQSPFVTIGYIYPPLLACLLTPLAPLTYVEARWAWFIISQVCLLLAAWLMWRAMGRDWLASCCVAFVWAVGDAAPETLGLGQLGPLLTLLLTIAYTQSAWRQASASGFGLALKLIPGVLGVVFLVRRQWRVLAVMAAVTLAALALPWAVVTCCLSGPKTPAGTDTWTGTPAILSWSLPSVALRIADAPARNGPLPPDWEFGNDLPNLRLPASLRWLSISVAAALLLSGLAVWIVSFKRGPTDIQRPFAMAALLSLSLAASPVCWTHYQVMEYPAVALLLCHALRSRRWGQFACVLVLGALLYPAPVQVLRYLAMKDGSWKLISHTALYAWTSVTPLASIAMFAVLLCESRFVETGRC